MRRFSAFLLATTVPISLGYAIACGPPDSFDKITGGTRPSDAASSDAPITRGEDPTLAAPRPLAPLSGSWVNGSRPRFRWAATINDAAAGARVVLCADIGCADTSKKREWDATGDELQAPEDLPPGRYYWRLVTINASSFGKDASPMWTMQVRGGKGDGWPGGAYCDVNGDGISDLVVGMTFEFAGTTVETFHTAFAFLGSSAVAPFGVVTKLDGPLASRDYGMGVSPGMTVDCGDIDGNGISDVVVADVEAANLTNARVVALKGERDFFDFASELERPTIPGLDAIPRIALPGDVDGDGYGDVLVGAKTFTAALFGTARGLGPFTYASQVFPVPDLDAGELPIPTTPQPVGGADITNDGLSDITFPLLFKDSGFLVAQSVGDRTLLEAPFGVFPGAGVSTPATAFAFGDIDGDGTNDVTFVTTVGADSAVCALLNMGKTPICWKPGGAPAGFASSLAAADVEGSDGKDEILVGNANGGVDVLSLTAPDKLDGARFETPYGARVTVLDPGRPAAAVWAATLPDGTGFAIFRGKTEEQKVNLADVPIYPQIKAIRFLPTLR